MNSYEFLGVPCDRSTLGDMKRQYTRFQGLRNFTYSGYPERWFYDPSMAEAGTGQHIHASISFSRSPSLALARSGECNRTGVRGCMRADCRAWVVRAADVEAALPVERPSEHRGNRELRLPI